MRKLNRACFLKSGAAFFAWTGLARSLEGPQARSGQLSAEIEKRLNQMGLSLPQAPKPVGAYVAARRSGNLLFVSMQFPYVEGKLLHPGGKVGREVSIEQGQEAFRACALNVLAQVQQNLGDFDRVSGVVKIVGYLCCAEGFADHAKALNGASEFFVDVLGAEKGVHARAVLGVQSLPLGAPVALEVTVEVKES